MYVCSPIKRTKFVFLLKFNETRSLSAKTLIRLFFERVEEMNGLCKTLFTRI